MDVVKYGIIGTGGAWSFHSIGLKGVPEAKITAVFDIEEKAANRVAKRVNATAYATLPAFLASDIDAVLVMVPHYLHEQYVIAAAEAHKHILCEKPMATTLEGCDQMIAATRKAGIKFMIAENHRFLPAHQYIHDVVERGWLGKVFLVRAYEGVNEITGLMRQGFWKGHPIKAGGGCLMDMGAHKFAAIEWILRDRATKVQSWLTKQCITIDEKAEDNALSLVQFEHGALGEIAVSFSVVTPPTNSMEVHGTLGSIVENHMWQDPVQIHSTHEEMGANKGQWFTPKIEHGPFPLYYNIAARLEDAHFTQCILHDTEPEFTPEAARSAIAGCLMGYLSARRGETVTYDKLMTVMQTTGTKSILEGLEQFVQKNA